MVDSYTRRLSVVAVGDEPDVLVGDGVAIEQGLADVVSLHRRSRATAKDPDEEERLFADTVAEYQWARDAAGLAPGTLEHLVQPILEVCDYFGVAAWRLTPQHLDRYFSGPGKRAPSTLRGKFNRIDHFFAFLEQRYAGEIAKRFGVAVESPVDEFNRPTHRGDFGLRVPPSQRALREFFCSWRSSLASARKPAVARRDYVMAKLTYLSGVRAQELCSVTVSDVHWESGQWGRILVQGKGAHGSGARPRFAYIFEEGRQLLWWYIEEVRGEFSDDPEHPRAPLFPSERIAPAAVSQVDESAAGIAVTTPTFRKALKKAAQSHLSGPVTNLYPHLLRHACATHNYERGMGLWEVQKLLGHDRPSTTVGYLYTAQADPERASLSASSRAVQRLGADEGRL